MGFVAICCHQGTRLTKHDLGLSVFNHFFNPL